MFSPQEGELEGEPLEKTDGTPGRLWGNIEKHIKT